jgi:hypothetical protein
MFSSLWLAAASAEEAFGFEVRLVGLSDPRATKATLRFLADSGRFNSLYSPPSEDPSRRKTSSLRQENQVGKSEGYR